MSILLTVCHTFHIFALSLTYFQSFRAPVALFQDLLVLENVTIKPRTFQNPYVPCLAILSDVALTDWYSARNRIVRVWQTLLAIAMIDYSGLEKFKSQQKIHFKAANWNYSETPKTLSTSGVYKNSQSIICANVTICAKGPANFRRVSCGYAEQSPLHFVLWLELSSSSTKTWRATGLDVSMV